MSKLNRLIREQGRAIDRLNAYWQGRVDTERARADDAQRRIDDILDLHLRREFVDKRTGEGTGQYYCDHCSLHPWPCPTVYWLGVTE